MNLLTNQEHFFLFCSSYAAQRCVLLTSAANIFGETWSSRGLSETAMLGNCFLLYSVQSVNYDVNCAFFREVQSFIIKANRFSVATV